MNRKRGFTLLELLIVVALLAVLAVVIILIINPAETLRKGRDSQRLSDLSTLKSALALYLLRAPSPDLDSGGDGACGTNIWIGRPEGSAEITDPSVSGRTLAAGGDRASTAIDGTGWIPVDFTEIPEGSPIAALPLDPNYTATDATNVSQARDFFYAYTCNQDNNSFEITANMESATFSRGGSNDKEAPDGGNQPTFYEIGTSLALLEPFTTTGPFYHPSPVLDDRCGNSVTAGDVNQDGKDDVIAGCSWDDNPASAQGSVVVLTRNAGNNGFDAGVVLYHPSPVLDDRCGYSVAAGDVNQDGKDDVIMSCVLDDNAVSQQGSAVVFTRNAGNDGFDAGVVLYHPSPVLSDQCGYYVAAGDVNQDGKDDVIMGCRWDDNAASNQGSAVVFTRNAGNDGFDAGVVLYHPSPVLSDDCGFSVAAGDVNQDGKDDVIMGCPLDDNAVSGQGSAVVFTRNAGNDGFDAGVVLYHPSPADDNCGASVAAGDVNQDGKDDVIAGCSWDDNGQGSAVVFTRNAGNDGFDAGVVLEHPSPVSEDECGDSVAAGDVNQDGKDDVIMGCYLDGNAVSYQGSAVVFTRNAGNDGFDAGVVLYHPSPVSDDECGTSVAAGDVNADTQKDPIMGCPP